MLPKTSMTCTAGHFNTVAHLKKGLEKGTWRNVKLLLVHVHSRDQKIFWTHKSFGQTGPKDSCLSLSFSFCCNHLFSMLIWLYFLHKTRKHWNRSIWAELLCSKHCDDDFRPDREFYFPKSRVFACTWSEWDLLLAFVCQYFANTTQIFK